MPSIILRIRQKGYVRAAGYQTTQWAVTVPVSDPAGEPLLGTQPLSYAPFFVIRNNGLDDTFVRVAALTDLLQIPHAELRYFDVLGPGGSTIFAYNPALMGVGPFQGDILTIPEASLSGRLSYWLEDAPPYTSGNFTVDSTVFKASGSNPILLSNNRLQLPGYTFTPNDVNRWIVLSGFANPGYNVPVQVLSYVGNTATINLVTGAGTITGGSWAMPVIRIATSANPSQEPRYFPTRETNIGWELRRGSTLIGSAAYGGVTSRWQGEPASTLVRTVRFTSVEATPAASQAVMQVVRNGVMNLQAAAELNNTDLTPLITSTYGP
jgi:hypothetical protein